MPLILYGCAAQPISIETGLPPTPSTPPGGHIVTRPGRPGLVVAAPHGTSDVGTSEIASEIARRTGFGLAIATGFSVGTGATDGRRYGVNRPFEGVPGCAPSEEIATDRARQIYDEYERRVRQTAAGPLRFYVELHGNGREHTAGRIEIATVGVDREAALQLRTLLELTRDAYLRGHPDAPRLDVLIEPADAIVYTASGAKRAGILRWPERALHIELPRAARREFRDVYTPVLADFLAQAVSLPPFR